MIKFKIIDSKTSNDYEMSPKEALMYIKTYLSQQGGWFYINGALTDIANVTEEMLDNAGKVDITNLIQGG